MIGVTQAELMTQGRGVHSWAMVLPRGFTKCVDDITLEQENKDVLRLDRRRGPWTAPDIFREKGICACEQNFLSQECHLLEKLQFLYDSL